LKPFLHYVNERMDALESVHAQGKDLGEAFRRLSAEVDRAAGTDRQTPVD
jgi:hypothetical protein